MVSEEEQDRVNSDTNYLGLQTVECPEIDADLGDELEINERAVVNKTNGRTFRITPLPAARQAIVDAGGLIAYTRERLIKGA